MNFPTTTEAPGIDTSNLFRLDNRIAVVTGGTGLLGRIHCAALAAAGAHIVVTDLDGERCDQVVLDLEGEHMGAAADVTDKGSVERLRDRILRRFDRIDILVNNAAINDMFESPAAAGELSKFENYPVEMFRRALDVNVTGTFLCAQVLGSEMARAGSGSIINIASTYGIVAPDQSIYRRPDGTQSFHKSAAYPATKGAILSFTRFLATYWGASGVRVNALSPGGVENGQEEYFIENYSRRTPLGRMASPFDYQGAILFLASDASAYMTGANLVVDGGWTSW
jgi:NAD(P)-dependent dehydrogenase (short-subunit alcohol dehydrogenase family)